MKIRRNKDRKKKTNGKSRDKKKKTKKSNRNEEKTPKENKGEKVEKLEEKKPIKESAIGLIPFLFLIFFGIASWLLSLVLEPLILMLGLPLWLAWVVVVPIVTIVFLLLFVRFTMVDEGTAKIIMRFGGILKVFIQWEGYEKNQAGDVVFTGKKTPWYGGLRVWLGTPWDKVYEYHLRFHTVEEKEGKREQAYRDIPKANYVELRPDRYWRKSTRVETGDGQFPDIEWQIGMRSKNPAKTIFKSPHNWVENALNELEPTLRAYARTKTLGELLNLTRTQIWADIGTDRAIEKVLKEEWGIQIDEQEIGIFDTSPPPGYQEALAAESRRKMEAAGRAEEILGTVIAAVVRATGAKENEIQAEFKKDPKAFYRKHETTVENTMTKLSMEEKAYLRMETPGATGMEGTFLRLIGAWQRMPKGSGRREERRETKEGRRKAEETEGETKVTKEEVEEAKRKYLRGEDWG